MSSKLSNKTKTGIVKNRANKEELKNYISQLKKEGKKFPVNNAGDVNQTQVAKACGFRRQVFANTEDMYDMLHDAVKEIGTEIYSPINSEKYVSKKNDENTKLINLLRKECAELKETIEALRKENMEIEKQNENLNKDINEKDESFNLMIETGRSFKMPKTRS